jgi:hypothetical protein
MLKHILLSNFYIFSFIALYYDIINLLDPDMFKNDISVNNIKYFCYNLSVILYLLLFILYFNQSFITFPNILTNKKSLFLCIIILLLQLLLEIYNNIYLSKNTNQIILIIISLNIYVYMHIYL